MQAELENEGLALDVRILGLNMPNNEVNNAVMCAHSSLPYLQDTTGEHAWQEWDVIGYDVIIVDENNVFITKYNVGAHTLVTPSNYYELKQMISDAAGK
ncbi:MAG: hypothetical protein KJ970_11180 [Candidatus Eisenbacteria bacterium]|uniref:Uncharacterized protein n=1 Tax=Eiseniibacteriota bacterium TaxID=2212470 RepID=A0A948W6G6_UNCEI|nr:hypothetical protein [Candidatus Eisenbacteria bacterium]MBU1948958.1 hypothetical protein [Candidatus Eisenbacteria bacterium]MBU2691479.1 hypothetical protein [Candidatus Eisenbacteria bacterium]